MFWIGYRIFIGLFELAIKLSSLWSPQSKLFLNGRKDQSDKLKNWLGANDSSLIQIHCASLGEFELSLPLYEQLKKSHPGHQFLFTFFSPSGYENAKIPIGCEKAYLPFDQKKKLTKFINLCEPVLVIFIKYEYWFQYLKELSIRNIPFGYVNVNQQIYPTNLKFSTAKKILQQAAFIFSSNEKTAADLKENGIRVDAIYQDLRYTKSKQLLNETYIPKPSIQSFLNEDLIIICGSVWKEDLAVIAPVIKANQDCKWIIAPHKVDPATINAIRNQLGLLSLFSAAELDDEHNILVVDTIGDLKYLYRYGALNYIGGAFKTGLHNVLEPIATGVSIVFGPNYAPYPEAVELINKGIGFSIKNEKEFNAIIKKLREGSLLLDSSDWLHDLDSGLEKMTKQISKFL